MQATTAQPARAMSRGIRRLTLAISGLAVVVGPLLYLLPAETDRLFAWTIAPPITAAFLGGAYCTALVIETLAARERVWARARVVYPAMTLFTSLTLIATLLHLDRFHFASTGALARLTAWLWLGIYIVAPVAMLWLLAGPARAPGSDAPRGPALPAAFRAALGGLGAIMALVGVALFLAPQAAGGWWPWALTPLTGQAVGAWLIGLGFAGAHAAWENAADRARLALVGNVVMGLLQLGAVARFAGALQWGAAPVWLYGLFLLSMVALGTYGLWWTQARARVEPAGA